MKPRALPNIQRRLGYRYAAVTTACFITATLQALAGGLLASFLQAAHLQRFEMGILLTVIPAHQLLWRGLCAAFGFSSVVLLLVMVGWSNLVGRRFQPLPMFAILVMTMSAYATLDSFMMMMTRFADLARDATYSYSPNQMGTMQMVSASATEFLTRVLLMANVLESVSGIMLSLCSFLTKGFPRVLAWLGLLLWLGTLNASVVAATGQVDLAMTIYLGSRVGLIIWASVFGTIFTFRAARAQAAEVKSRGKPKCDPPRIAFGEPEP